MLGNNKHKLEKKCKLMEKAIPIKERFSYNCSSIYLCLIGHTWNPVISLHQIMFRDARIESERVLAWHASLVASSEWPHRQSSSTRSLTLSTFKRRRMNGLWANEESKKQPCWEITLPKSRWQDVIVVCKTWMRATSSYLLPGFVVHLFRSRFRRFLRERLQ